MFRFLTLSFLFVIVTNTYAQPPDTLWTRTYGGLLNEVAHSVEQTTDGGYVVAGFTGSFGAGGMDFYLVKTNSEGDTLWTRTYGGGANEEARSVQLTSDGGYVLAGYTRSFGAGGYDFYIVRTNAQGDTVWTRTYGTAFDELATAIQQTADGGYIVTGSQQLALGNQQFCLVKLNPDGTVLWSHLYGGDGEDDAWAVRQTADGGFAVAGALWNGFDRGQDMDLVRTNSQGDTLWTRTYGGTYDDWAFSMDQTADGGYVLAGITESFGSVLWDIYLVGVNAQGDTLWTRTYGGGENDWAWSVKQLSDGGCALAGATESFGAGGSDVYLIRTNSAGDTLWTRTFGGLVGDVAYSVRQTTDGGLIIAGNTASFGAGADDFYLIRVASDLAAPDPFILSPSSFLLSAFPNPFNPSTTISFSLPQAGNVKLAVYDVTGREVKVLANQTYPAGDHSVTFDGTGLPSGIYFVRMDAGEISQTKKMALIK